MEEDLKASLKRHRLLVNADPHLRTITPVMSMPEPDRKVTSFVGGSMRLK